MLWPVHSPTGTFSVTSSSKHPAREYVLEKCFFSSLHCIPRSFFQEDLDLFGWHMELDVIQLLWLVALCLVDVSRRSALWNFLSNSKLPFKICFSYARASPPFSDPLLTPKFSWPQRCCECEFEYEPFHVFFLLKIYHSSIDEVGKITR